MPWENFKLEEFKCSHCGKNEMKEDFIDILQTLRTRCLFPLPIISGYRCPEHNQKVSSTGPTGPHTTGRAADIAVDRDRAVVLLEYALEIPVIKGIGLNQKGTTGRFIHLDAIDRPRRTIWTY